MKKIVLISILSLLVTLFAVFIIPSNGGVEAMDLTTTTTFEEVTTEAVVTEEEPIVIDPAVIADALKDAIAAKIDEFLGDYLLPLGITGAMVVGCILFLLGYLLKQLSRNKALQLTGEKLMNDNKKSVDKLAVAVIDGVTPVLNQFALETTRSNAFSAVIASGLDILIMASNNEQVALASKEFHRLYSEALSLKSADENTLKNIQNSIVMTLKQEASKVVENTVQTLTKVKNDSLARLKAKVEQPESGV